MKHFLTIALVMSLTALLRAGDASKPVKVFILAGQSNMEGKAKVAVADYQAQQPATRDLYKHLQKDGQWIERKDVWFKYFTEKGNLTVGYGNPKCIGPELEEPGLRARLARDVQQAYEAKVSRIDPALMRHIEKDVMLRTLDAHWRDHLGAIDRPLEQLPIVGIGIPRRIAVRARLELRA